MSTVIPPIQNVVKEFKPISLDIPKNLHEDMEDGSVVALYSENDDTDKCDYCSKTLNGGGVWCDGLCQREICYDTLNYSSSYKEKALYCGKCVKRFKKSAEGLNICQRCQFFYEICVDCKMLICNPIQETDKKCYTCFKKT